MPRVPRHDVQVPARVIVLAGPSGSGKSHLAERLALPLLRLDDFYRDGSDPELPRITSGANTGLVDWDDPASWLCSEAVEALATLCRTGTVETPVYSISANGRTGTQTLSLSGSPLVVAEGIFAHHVVARCARPACSRRRTACASTPSSRSGGGSPATCASTASRRWCWSAAAWRWRTTSAGWSPRRCRSAAPPSPPTRPSGSSGALPVS